VGFQGEFARDALALGSRDVERHRFLSAVDRQEVSGLARVLSVLVLEERRTPAARVVARARPLHFDDLRAEVGEVLRCPGPGENAGEIEDSNMRERARHGRSERGPADYFSRTESLGGMRHGL